MKHHLARIVVVVFALYIMFGTLVPFVPSTQAVTLPNHVVINEFAQFPIGGDYNKQWIEIYNPTATPVNVGNWKIVTFYGTTRTIPADTVVPSNGYFVFMLNGIVLAHNGEQITLKDASNNIVDKTAKKSATTASASTWQRYPNGVDSDGDGDWQFRAGTKWASNGGETVSMSISSSTIVLGDDVTLSGTVDPAHVTNVRIQASVDGGASWINITMVTSSSAGGYSYIVIPLDVGSYMFKAVLPWDRGVVSGTVSLVVNKLSSQISIFADKTVKERESISLTGFISPVRPTAQVTITIGMPNGTYITRTATTNSAGYFNYTFAPDDPGIWNATTSWNGDSITQGATSSMVHFTVEPLDNMLVMLPILLIIPVVAVLLIVLGVGLGRGERRAAAPLQYVVQPRRFPPRVGRRLFPTRPRVLPARVCLGCGGPLIYSAQYQRWYCSRCRRYV